MNKHFICIWMNRQTHYQSALFEAMNKRADVDLQVRYFKGVLLNRINEGWAPDTNYMKYERSVESCLSISESLATVPDWRNRIHILSSNFSQELVKLFCLEEVKWVHWSEMPGFRLAELLGYRMNLFSLLNPLMCLLKRNEGALIRNHALYAMGQGILARKAFRMMGIPNKKIVDLYYTPAPLDGKEPSTQILEFASGRKVFLTVAALDKRKGIDVLLKAFSKLATNNWCLVLCGMDKSKGQYEQLTKRLGISNQVLFLGAYPVHRISEVYLASDVFVLPSRFDGWGAVLNEAASVGMPLVATEMCGAAWHLINPDKNGYRARTGSVRSLTKMLRQYLTKPELIKVHGQQSKLLFEEEFTPEKNAQRLISNLSLYNNL